MDYIRTMDQEVKGSIFCPQLPLPFHSEAEALWLWVLAKVRGTLHWCQFIPALTLKPSDDIVIVNHFDIDQFRDSQQVCISHNP